MTSQTITNESFAWSWAGRPMSLGVSRAGHGPVLLLLPAPSSISTRAEMQGLQACLSDRFETIAVDLPGFGVAPKQTVAWSPDALRGFLCDVLAQVRPLATIAAGHMGIYALQQAARDPASTGSLVMIAPTWRGPLPTMLRRRPRWLSSFGPLADMPRIGSTLYRVNLNGPMIRMMARGHVYADGAWLNAERLADKRAVVDAAGARHASLRFVAGLLDPAESREAVLAAARRLDREALMIFGAKTPPKSRAEMMALSAGSAAIRPVELPDGKLAVHEECPDAVGEAVHSFLAAAAPIGRTDAAIGGERAAEDRP